jgi:RHS repeat-associated protein
VPVIAYLDEGVLDRTTLTEPVRFGGQLAGVLENGRFAPIATDLRGTVIADRDGTPRLASPFGARTLHPDRAAALDFAARAYDADLGLVRMGVRDYDANLGLFVTPDPLFLRQPERCEGDPVSCTLYAYADNDPLGNVDPTGMAPASPEQMRENLTDVSDLSDRVTVGLEMVKTCLENAKHSLASESMLLSRMIRGTEGAQVVLDRAGLLLGPAFTALGIYQLQKAHAELNEARERHDVDAQAKAMVEHGSAGTTIVGGAAGTYIGAHWLVVGAETAVGSWVAGFAASGAVGLWVGGMLDKKLDISNGIDRVAAGNIFEDQMTSADRKAAYQHRLENSAGSGVADYGAWEGARRANQRVEDR